MVASVLLALMWLASVRVEGIVKMWPWTLRVRGGLVVLGYYDDDGIDRKTPLLSGQRRLTQEIGWWFKKDSWTSDHVPGGWRLHMPLWPFILVTGATGRWMLTRSRFAPHECAACGYDMTGLAPTSKEPAQCPECGKSREATKE